MADQIDKTTLEVAQADDEVYSDMQALADELPGHSPRYVLLSYPLTLVCYAISDWGIEWLMRLLGVRPTIRSLCPHLLLASHMQRGTENAVRRSERADEEYG